MVIEVSMALAATDRLGGVRRVASGESRSYDVIDEILISYTRGWNQKVGNSA